MLKALFGGVSVTKICKDLEENLSRLHDVQMAIAEEEKKREEACREERRRSSSSGAAAGADDDDGGGDDGVSSSSNGGPRNSSSSSSSSERAVADKSERDADGVRDGKNKSAEETKPKKSENEVKRDAIEKKISGHIEKMVTVLCGENGKAPDASKCEKVGGLVVQSGLMKNLIVKIADLSFESRKSVEKIFTALVHGNYGKFQTEFLMDPKNEDIFKFLIRSYEGSPEIALVCGEMLRLCIEKKAIAPKIVNKENLTLFFTKYLHRRNFTVQSDALSTFKLLVDSDCLTDFLTDDENFSYFFSLFHKELVLRLDEYVNVRESLKILGNMLLKRKNYKIMIKYVGEKENLKVIMTVMAHKAAVIKLEAFHVFKVFAANPHKTPPVQELLYHNRERLIAYLQNFKQETEDKQTREELDMLVKVCLKKIEEPKKADGGGGGGGGGEEEEDDDDGNKSVGGEKADDAPKVPKPSDSAS